MKKNQVVILLLLCATMAGMTGCSGKAEAGAVGNAKEVLASETNAGQQQETLSKAEVNSSQTYTKTMKNTEFNSEVQSQESLDVYKTKAEKITFDKARLEKALGKTISDGESEEQEEGWFLADSEGIRFATKLGEHIANSVDLDARDGNLDKYEKDGELSFMSKQEAYEKVLAQLKDMGIDVGDAAYTSYALDYETMKAQEFVMDEDGSQMEEYKKKDWKLEDDCYLFLIRQKVQEIPEYHVYGNVFVRMEEGNAPIQVCYSKNGIESMEIENVFRFTQEEEALDLLEFDKITESVVKELENRDDTSSYQVTSAQFCFMTPKFGSEMTPVWVFQSEETTTEGDHYPVTVVINAQNGKLQAIGTR